MKNRENNKKIPANFRLRNEIRNKHIQHIFQLKRSQMIPSFLPDLTNDTIFKQLEHQITENIHQPVNLHLINKLLAILERQSGNQNTFILIGNYLIDHPNAEMYLMPRIIGVQSSTYKLHNWKWVIVLGIVAKNQANSWDKQTLADYDKVISQLIKLSLSENELRKSIEIACLLLNICEQNEQKPYMPTSSIIQIQNKISTIYRSDMRQDVKCIIVEVCCQILQNFFMLSSLQQSVENLNFQIYMSVMYLALSQFPNFREEYLWFLQKLTLNFSAFIEHFIHKTGGGQILVKEIFYLLSQCMTHRKVILQILRYWSHMFSIQNLVNLLNKGLHIDLLEIVMNNDFQYHKKGQINKYLPNQQSDFSEQPVRLIALKNIKVILDRLKQKQQDRLLEGVLNDIDSKGFQPWVHLFYEQRQDKQLEDTLSQILDDYYSDEVFQ